MEWGFWERNCTEVFILWIIKYLNRCLASVVSNHEVHGDVFTVQVFVDPISNVRRHHVCKQVTEILRRQQNTENSVITARLQWYSSVGKNCNENRGVKRHHQYWRARRERRNLLNLFHFFPMLFNRSQTISRVKDCRWLVLQYNSFFSSETPSIFKSQIRELTKIEKHHRSNNKP